jgi:predicted nucleotidyltransferase
MNNKLLDNAKRYLGNNKAVKFAYLFGSYARGDSGPLSDIDLAVYLDNRIDFFSCRLHLLEEVSRQLKGKPCDLVVLNNADLSLQYEILRDGKIFIENRLKRIQFETRVIRDYLDFESIRSVHLSSLKKSFHKGAQLG